MNDSTQPDIPQDLRELYDAALPLVGTALWVPNACDRTVELIERIARAESALADMVAERDEMKRQRDLYAEGLKKEEADCEALEAENERLKAPVSDEEWEDVCTLPSAQVAWRHEIDALLSHRERGKRWTRTLTGMQ